MDDRNTLVVDNLNIVDGRGNFVVKDVSFRVGKGRVLAVIGESGCGKTSVALALMAFARSGMSIASGQVLVDGEDMLLQSPAELRRRRGRLITNVPQNPTTAFSPRMRIGRQMAELLPRIPGTERREMLKAALRGVSLPDTDQFLRRYPFELSGGQLQRVAIAMAMINRPAVVVMDEPTTGLDVSTQQTILELLKQHVTGSGASVVYVTHDLAVVEAIADDVAVMYAGQVVEAGTRKAVFADPQHPYTRKLFKAVPRRHASRLEGIAGVAVSPAARPVGCAFAARCDMRIPLCLEVSPETEQPAPGHSVRCHRAGARDAETPRPLPARPKAVSSAEPIFRVAGLSCGYHALEVVKDISFDLGRGECVALVGESGSGKTTIGRAITGLHRKARGQLTFEGRELNWPTEQRQKADRRAIQIVFQNPDRSLNPRESVSRALSRTIRLTGERTDVEKRTAQLLDRVRLPRRMLDLYPGDLSGGERQRVAIARALATNPRLMVCDEITSALDVSIQAAVIELLRELKEDGLSMIFITHNLPLVSAIAEKAIVLKGGRIQESGSVRDVMEHPRSDFTKALLSAAVDFGA